MVAWVLTLIATSHFFNIRCFVQPGARYTTRPAGCSHVRYAGPGVDILAAAITNGFTAVENANKLLEFGDLLQKWSSVMPGAKLMLEVGKSNEAEVLKHVEKIYAKRLRMKWTTRTQFQFWGLVRCGKPLLVRG